MVDKALFVDMGGAKSAMRSLRVIANNLANTNTIGFRADFETAKPHKSHSNDKLQTRIYAASMDGWSDMRQGPITDTGRDLDVAIRGKGYIAVQTKEGQEAYTRAGNLEIGANGVLMTARGDVVKGIQGLINIPPSSRITISESGVVTVQPMGQGSLDLANVGQIKIVDIAPANLKKNVDGLYYPKDGINPPPSSDVTLVSGALEGSNVDPVQALTSLIDMSRQFEIHTRLMKSVEDNSGKVNQLLADSEA